MADGLKKPLYGYWLVDEFAIDGTERPLLITDEIRWQKAIFDLPAILSVQGMNGKLQRFRAQFDMAKKTITLTKRANQWTATLAFDNPTPELMTMDGLFGSQQVHIKLHRYDPKYLLKTRGFHWIHEFPYNR